MKTPDQIKHFKQMLLDYNGSQAADYENILQVLIDSGAGGGGVSAWADGLLEDWTDVKGVLHKGLIDAAHDEYSIHSNKYPNASDKLKLVSPQKYKREMFDALIEMMSLDLITFSETYDSKGYLTLVDENGEAKQYKLSNDEELALINMDIAKEELVSIYAFKSTNNNVRYDLPPDKLNKIGDDRAYTIAMLAWFLKTLRRESITSKKREKIDITQYMFHN